MKPLDSYNGIGNKNDNYPNHMDDIITKAVIIGMLVLMFIMFIVYYMGFKGKKVGTFGKKRSSHSVEGPEQLSEGQWFVLSCTFYSNFMLEYEKAMFKTVQKSARRHAIYNHGQRKLTLFYVKISKVDIDQNE